jgi:hypothetical protein
MLINAAHSRNGFLQASVTDATAIKFFMGSGNFDDLLSAELAHVGFPVAAKGGAMVSQQVGDYWFDEITVVLSRYHQLNCSASNSQMKIVNLSREQQAGAVAAARPAAPANGGTRQGLLMVLAVVGMVYVVIAVNLLMKKKAGQVEAEDGNEGSALVAKGEASGGYGGEEA